MSQGNLKNMVVLKNLPSNLVEEAIVILKSKNIREYIKIFIISKLTIDFNYKFYLISLFITK